MKTKPEGRLLRNGVLNSSSSICWFTGYWFTSCEWTEAFRNRKLCHWETLALPLEPGDLPGCLQENALREPLQSELLTRRKCLQCSYIALNQTLTECLWSTYLHHEVNQGVQYVHIDFTVSSKCTQPTERLFKPDPVAGFLPVLSSSGVCCADQWTTFFKHLAISELEQRAKHEALLWRPACDFFDICTCLNWNVRQWHQPAAPCSACKNTVVERKKPRGGIISQTEITGGWNGPGWVIFHLPAWLVSRIRDLKWNYSVAAKQGNQVGTEVPEEVIHKAHPKEVEERVIYFSVTLIACERFLVLCVSGQDGLTPSYLREKEITGSAVSLLWGRHAWTNANRFF